MFLVRIFSLCEVKRIALTILFRFKAMAGKRHSSVTAGMPRFLNLERQCSRLSTGTILPPIFWADTSYVNRYYCQYVRASIKIRIATASKNYLSNACLLKTSEVLLTMSASVALHLITPQIFSACLAVVQPLVNKFRALWTTKRILLG